MDKEQAQIKFLEWAQNHLDQGLGTAKSELPAVLNEYLQVLMIQNVVGVVVSLLVLIFSVSLAIYFFRSASVRDNGFKPDGFILSAFSVSLGIVSLILSIKFSIATAALYVAPKGYLLDQFLR